MTILEEAQAHVYGDRQQAYTHAFDNFAHIGRVWAAILNVPEISPEVVGLMMAGLKIAREMDRPQRDNLTDAAGYIGCVEQIQDERQRRRGRRLLVEEQQ